MINRVVQQTEKRIHKTQKFKNPRLKFVVAQVAMVDQLLTVEILATHIHRKE